ncbi:rolling circle replication-associated protein, partial [Paracoccus liaowanqingii]|uniref:rolling circle replication-associated protein n=1 Tax=Paracoccus liaowanqingii TaxID=2560053 RepID=UPI0019810D56
YKGERGCPITKIDKDHYCLNETGEIHEFEKSMKRTDSMTSLLRTMRKIREYINANFTGGKNELFVTLTYETCMTDITQLGQDTQNFLARLKYFCQKKWERNGIFEYIWVREVQERGAWHLHLLIKFPRKRSVYLANEDVRKIWGNGFVNVKRLKNVTNVGAYISAYLTDLVEEEQKKYYKRLENRRGHCFTKIAEKEKRVIKGGRCHLYPTGMRLFGHSKGITPPKAFVMSYAKAKEYFGV